MYPTKKLGEICDILLGGTPSRNEESFWGGDNLWCSIADMKEKIIFDTKEKITDFGIANSNVKLLSEGTLFMSFKLSIGKLAFAGKNLYTNEAIAGLPIKNPNELNKNFLYYALLGYEFGKTGSDNSVKGATLNKEKLKQIPIPLPPLPTQQKIVFKLDSLFEKLDQAITLTKQNLANIEELNKSILEKIFKECEEKYEKRKLDEVSTIITGNTPSTKFPEYYGGNILWAGPADIGDNKIINFTSKTLSQKGLIDGKARLVKKGSVLLVSIGTIGKVGIAGQDLTTNQQINSFEVNEKISGDFLYYFFQFYQKILKTLASKTVVPIINKTQCSQVLIPLPPLPEQQKIVEYLDNIFAKNKILQEKYKQNLKNFEELKQSILKQAFENEDFIK